MAVQEALQRLEHEQGRTGVALRFGGCLDDVVWGDRHAHLQNATRRAIVAVSLAGFARPQPSPLPGVSSGSATDPDASLRPASVGARGRRGWGGPGARLP